MEQRWGSPKPLVEDAIDYLGIREEFPGLPHSFARILQVSPSDPNAFEIYLGVLQAEPGFAAKVLSVANSAIFGFREPVTNLRAALIRLGTSATRSTVLSAAILEALRPCLQLLRHSVASASFSARVGAAAGFEEPEDLFAAALVHDIGKLLLSQAQPEAMKARAAQYGDKGLAEERARFGGLDHSQIGAYFAHKWNLPPLCAEVIGNHHGPAGSRTLPGELIAQANRWTANYYDADLSQAPNTEDIIRWAERTLELSRDRFLEACTRIPGDVARLCAKLDTKPASASELVSLLQQANVALGEASLEAEAERRKAGQRADQLELLKELALAAAEAGGLDALCNRAVTLIHERASVGIVSIQMANGGGELYLQAAVGLPRELIGETVPPDANAISRHAAREGKPILVRNLSQDQRFTAPDQANRYTTDTALSAPILHGGKVLGVLNVNNKSGRRPLDEDDKDFFMTVAYHLGTCLHGVLERQRRERADQRFRHLATRAPVPMMGFDLEGRVWLWNHALQELTGWPAKDVLGKPVLECFFPSEERAGSPAEWVARIRKGETVEKQELTLTDAQGHPQILQYNVFPADQGNLGVWVGVNLTAERAAQRNAERRASEIHATQKVLTDLISQLEQEEMLDRLAVWMAHVLSCRRSVVCVRETAGDTLKCHAVHGFAAADDVETPPFRALFEHILNAPGPLFANQPAELPDSTNAVFQTVGNAAGAPLRIRGEIVGVLGVFDRKQGGFTEHDEGLLSDMANVASVALEVAHAHGERVHNEHLRTAVAMAVSFNHEVNSPLQTIMGSVDLIATERELPDEVYAALDSISDAVKRISTVNAQLRQAIQKSSFRTYPSGLPMVDIPPPGQDTESNPNTG